MCASECDADHGHMYPVSVSLSGKATSLFIYFTSVLASVPFGTEVYIGAGSGGQLPPLEIFWPPLDDFCPPHTFILGHNSQGTLVCRVKKTLQNR